MVPRCAECYALVSKVVCLIVVTMSEQEVHVSVAHHVIFKFLVCEGVKLAEILHRFRAQFGRHFSVKVGKNCNIIHACPRTSITQQNMLQVQDHNYNVS